MICSLFAMFSAIIFVYLGVISCLFASKNMLALLPRRKGDKSWHTQRFPYNLFFETSRNYYGHVRTRIVRIGFYWLARSNRTQTGCAFAQAPVLRNRKKLFG
uniref:Uncharacterized protein n=1 Tax=Candidatus Kentrum sp. DK TaxID=2126562 RepID=A0A450SDR2_9GAMM|nr:MAG: hypothetical protein BECKDK2373C_GA0170839_102933 [Candidatus Kentron sp. DK]